MNNNKKKNSPINRVNSVNKFLSPKNRKNEYDKLSTPKLEKKNLSKLESDELMELNYSSCDDYKTIVKKNAKLRNLLIKAYSSLQEITNNLKQKEEAYKIEKAIILEELDRITTNYKIYGESHKKYILLEKEYDMLYREYDKLNLESKKNLDSLTMVVEDSLELYELVLKIESPSIDIKTFVNKNIQKYKNLIEDLNIETIKIKYKNLPLIFVNKPSIYRKDSKENKLKEYNYPLKENRNKNQDISLCNNLSGLNDSSISNVFENNTKDLTVDSKSVIIDVNGNDRTRYGIIAEDYEDELIFKKGDKVIIISKNGDNYLINNNGMICFIPEEKVLIDNK